MNYIIVAYCIAVALALTGLIVGFIKTKVLNEYSEKYLALQLPQMAAETADRAARWAGFTVVCGLAFVGLLTFAFLNL